MVNASKSWDRDDLLAFTVKDVISGKRPVLYVNHDVSDGSWDFHRGEEVTADEITVVELADIVKTDPSLDELADLPLGWYAERPAPGAPWVRQPGFPTEWNELVALAEEYTNDCQERVVSEFSLEEWERFDYDQETNSLVFSSAGAPRVAAKAQIVGSWSARANTWLWSWNNESLPPDAAGYVPLLRQFGEQHDFERLKTPHWPADEADGWEMACVACLLLQGEGIYRAPDEGGALFMVMMEPEFVDG